MTTIDEDRETFRTRIMASRRLINEGEAEAANAEVEALNPLAERWNQEGRLVEFLAPLLDESEKPYVRYNAASGLLHRGHPDLAIPALETVSAGKGLAALGAERLLRSWRKQHA